MIEYTRILVSVRKSKHYTYEIIETSHSDILLYFIKIDTEK